jgi:hypothetical protein
MGSASRSCVPPAERAGEVRWSGFDRGLLPSYLRFAIASWGRDAHQANPQYPQWLYEENPAGATLARDFLVGLDESGHVVACAHKLRLPWNVGGSRVDVPALHNLMAAPSHRQGIGGVLMLTALARDAHVLVPGSTEPLSSSYRRLGSQPIEAAWYRWVLDPLGGGARFVAGRFGVSAPRWPTGRLRSVRYLMPGLRVEDAPSRARHAEIAAALTSDVDAGTAAPAWTPDLVAWRFFHPLGPRHLVIDDGSDGFLAIVSLGRRHGVRVARLLEVRARDHVRLRRGIARLRAALLILGGDVLLGFVADAQLADALAAVGGRRRSVGAPQTWVYHRQRSAAFARWRFGGGAGDHGFDAL